MVRCLVHQLAAKRPTWTEIWYSLSAFMEIGGGYPFCHIFSTWMFRWGPVAISSSTQQRYVMLTTFYPKNCVLGKRQMLFIDCKFLILIVCITFYMDEM